MNTFKGGSVLDGHGGSKCFFFLLPCVWITAHTNLDLIDLVLFIGVILISDNDLESLGHLTWKLKNYILFKYYYVKQKKQIRFPT